MTSLRCVTVTLVAALAAAQAPAGLTTCTSACCTAASSFIATVHACPSHALLETVVWAEATSSAAHVAAAAFACASPCYTTAVAGLRAAVAGQAGDGCGFARAFLYRNDQACATASTGACATADFYLRGLAATSSMPSSHAVRVNADAYFISALRDYICGDPCYFAVLSALVNVSVAASAALPGYRALYPYTGASDVQVADMAADAGLLLTASIVRAVVRRGCAKDAASGNYCAVLLGADFDWPDLNVSAADPLDTRALTRGFAHPFQAVCSPCAFVALNTDATVAGAVLRIVDGLGGAAALTAIATVAPNVTAALRAQLVMAPIAVALPAAVEPLCGVSPSGATCLDRAATFQIGGLVGLSDCIPYLTAGGVGACPGVCSAALATMTASLGCCFGPLLRPLVSENAALVASVLGTANFSVIASAAANCGAPLTPCAVATVAHLAFRIRGLNGTRVAAWGVATRAAFTSALLADVAAVLNVAASTLTLVSLTPDAAGGVIAAIDVRAPTADAVAAVAAQASAQASAGLVAFPAAAAVAVSAGSTADGSQALTADPAYGAASPSSASGAAGAALAAGATAAAVAVAAWLLHA